MSEGHLTNKKFLRLQVRHLSSAILSINSRVTVRDCKLTLESFFFFINHNLAFVYTGNRNLKIFSYAQVREEFAGKCLGITCLSREGFLIFKRGPESLCNGDLKQHFFCTRSVAFYLFIMDMLGTV